MKDKNVFMEEFNNRLHRLGRITLVLAVVFLVALPFVFGAVYGVSPDMAGFLAGFAKVGVIYIPVAIVEFLVYTPMLGVGGSYLSFITGNVTNIITGLKDYIGSSNTYGLRPNFSYGLTAIKKLKEYILSSTLNLGMRRIDDRYTRALAEHQYVIMQCVKFLTEKKKLDINSEDVGLVDTLYQKAKMLHMLGIKFNISQDKEILQSILSGFQYILDHSNKPLCKVIDSLRYI